MFDLIVNLYGLLYKRAYIPNRLMSPFRVVIRMVANRIMPFFLKKKCKVKKTPRENRSKKVVVSLTSFPGRIESVWMVVECMLRQTLCPDCIILWLSKEQFPDEKIPQSLMDRIGSVFQVRFVPNDYRSHKKYLYAFSEYPNDIVITIDDDIFYPTTLISSLYESYKKNSHSVICCYGKEFYCENNNVAKYESWKEYFDLNSSRIFFGSGGGTLFIPSELYRDVLNINLAMNLCPYADDIWLNIMARMADLNVVLIVRRLILPICKEDDSRLCSINVGQNLNDVQISNVCSYYNRNFFGEKNV